MSPSAKRGDNGYASKEAAQALLGRLYLYKGEWQKCIDTCSEVLGGDPPFGEVQGGDAGLLHLSFHQAEHVGGLQGLALQEGIENVEGDGVASGQRLPELIQIPLSGHFLLDDLGTLWAQQIDGKPHPVGVDIVTAGQDAFIDQSHADIQDLCPGVALPQRAKGQILAFAADQAGFHGLPGGEQPRVPKIFDLLLFGI